MQNDRRKLLAVSLTFAVLLVVLVVDRCMRAAPRNTPPASLAVAAPPTEGTRTTPDAPNVERTVPPEHEGVDAGATDEPLPVSGEVLARDQLPADADGLSIRRTLVKTSMKYPLVLVEDRVWKDHTGRDVARSQQSMVADHVIVGLRPGSDEVQLRALVQKCGAELRGRLYAPSLYLVSFPAKDVNALSRLIEVFNKEAGVLAYAEPDWIVHAVETVPGESGFSQLWAMRNTGQTGGTPGADIKATMAWDQGTGSQDVLVGVIDTGVDYTHPDLQANIWTNWAENTGTSGVDDDGNGLVDDIHGYDFAYDDGDPLDGDGHGTHTSGSIGASGDNQTGVYGVCWSVTIVPIKFLDDSGSGYTSDAVSGVYYATRLGCRLTSNSWGGGGYSQSMYDAIADAGNHGILFVAAAGNSGRNMDKVASYPAGFSNENIISVAATDHNDQKPRWSNYGATTVDLGAPGVGIVSTLPDSAYASWSGTSMATPHVSGAVALLWSLRPGATHLQIKKKILSSVDPVASLAGKTVTGGRLNLYRAVSNQPPVIESSAWADPNPVVLPAGTTTASVVATDPDDDPLTYAWSGPSGVNFANPTAATTGVTLPDGQGGSYLLQVSVSDGHQSVASSVTVNAVAQTTGPTVTVIASDATASEANNNRGTFSVSRSQASAASLTVRFTLSGTAANGVDYRSLSDSVTIGSGATSASVSVRPINDALVEGSETVVLTLNPDAAYQVGSSGSATVTILDND